MARFHKSIRLVVSKDNASFRPVVHRYLKNLAALQPKEVPKKGDKKAMGAPKKPKGKDAPKKATPNPFGTEGGGCRIDLKERGESGTKSLYFLW